MDENDGKRPAGEVVALRATRPCPICGQASTRAAYPFCSPRCADLDLGRWLKGRYVIPAAEGEEDEDEPAQRS